MANYYVSALGDDAAAGSYSAPFRTVQQAHTTATSGDHIFLADAWGVFLEDWASGYPQITEDSINISSLYPDAPCTLGGLTSTFGVRFGAGLTNVRFSHIIFTSISASVTSIVGVSSGTATTGIEFVSCSFVVNSDAGASGLLVNAGGAGAHADWKFTNCKFDSSSRSFGGIFVAWDGWEIVACTFIGASNGTTIQIRIDSDCHDVIIKDTKVTGYIGIQQDTTDANAEIRITNIKINSISSGITIGGTSAGILSLMVEDCYIDAGGIGFAIQGDNVDFAISNSVANAANPCWGLPTDGNYVNVTGSAKNITANAEKSGTAHALLLGKGAIRVNITDSCSVADQGAYSIVVKGSGNYIDGNQFTGGTVECIYFKGCVDSVFSHNKVSYRQGANVIAFADQDGLIPSGCRITDNTFTATSGQMFDVPVAVNSGLNTVDYNVYNVEAYATWGNVDDTAVNSFSEVQAAWDLTTNDNHSAEERSPIGGERSSLGF